MEPSGRSGDRGERPGRGDAGPSGAPGDPALADPAHDDGAFDDVEFDDPRFDELSFDGPDLARRPPIEAVLAQPEPGFPGFRHNQWTIEGEIERFGAFGRGAAAARGWKRVVAMLLIVVFLLPIALGVVSILRAVVGA